MTASVALIDYGAGNMFSIEQALRFIGADVVVIADADQWAEHDPAAVILPGVGAYGKGMEALRARGLDEALVGHAAEGRPLLGICLGAQLLLDGSTEFGAHRGLGIVPGMAVPFDPALVRVPHIGWGRISGDAVAEADLFDGVPAESWMYFVHSFHLEPTHASNALSTTSLGQTSFTSAIRQSQSYGVQFHPEKSGLLGLRILENFLNLKASP